MKKLSKIQKNIVKWICVVVILALIVYVFRDSAGPILAQLKKTKASIVCLIVIATSIYGLCESAITCILAKQYNKKFRYMDALGMTYFCSFYRTATLGSGAGVAAVVYLNSCGIKSSEALGMYTIEYAIHKLGIAVLAAVLFITNYSYMSQQFIDYKWYIILGFVATIVITAALMLFACAAWFHRLLYFLMDKVNFKGRFTEQFEKVKAQCVIMEESAKVLLKDIKMLVGILFLNMLKFCFWFIIPYIVLYSTGKLTIYSSLGITAVCVMLAAVIPAPAGIGSSEFVLIALYSGLVGSAQAGTMSLLYRFATFVVPFIVGAFVAIFFGRIKRKKMENLVSDEKNG
ncbi:MAG: YbhN family protein [Coprococcus sp.]